MMRNKVGNKTDNLLFIEDKYKKLIDFMNSQSSVLLSSDDNESVFISFWHLYISSLDIKFNRIRHIYKEIMGDRKSDTELYNKAMVFDRLVDDYNKILELARKRYDIMNKCEFLFVDAIDYKHFNEFIEKYCQIYKAHIEMMIIDVELITLDV